MPTEVIYTDGACNGNGTTTATGGSGIYISKSALTDPTKINRKGAPMEFRRNENLCGFFHVTNIRMEGIAIVSTLALYANMLIDDIPVGKPDVVKRLNECDPFNTNTLKESYGPNELRSANKCSDVSIEIVTDSKFWMDVIKSWMPGWIKKGIMLEEKKSRYSTVASLLYGSPQAKRNRGKVHSCSISPEE